MPLAPDSCDTNNLGPPHPPFFLVCGFLIFGQKSQHPPDQPCPAKHAKPVTQKSLPAKRSSARGARSSRFWGSAPPSASAPPCRVRGVLHKHRVVADGHSRPFSGNLIVPALHPHRFVGYHLAGAVRLPKKKVVCCPDLCLCFSRIHSDGHFHICFTRTFFLSFSSRLRACLRGSWSFLYEIAIYEKRKEKEPRQKPAHTPMLFIRPHRKITVFQPTR